MHVSIFSSLFWRFRMGLRAILEAVKGDLQCLCACRSNLHICGFYLKWNRAYSDVSVLAGSYELGNFEQDLKPYLKQRKSSSVDKIIQIDRQKQQPVIICKNKQLNHFRNQSYDKFKPLPLASRNWKSTNSKGDHFTILINTKDYIPIMKPSIDFSDTGLERSIIEILQKNNMKIPSQIQRDAIPLILDGGNNLLAAETGCGKTVAFLAPIVQQVMHWRQVEQVQAQFNAPLALIITPNRELSYQIHEVAEMFKELGVQNHLMLGGRSRDKIFNPKFQEVDILTTTVGIIKKLIASGVYSLNNVKHIVLDEADTLLDDSFNEILLDLLKKFQFRENSRGMGVQLTMSSATMPTSLTSIIEDVIPPDGLNKVKTSKLHHILPHVKQKFIRVGKSNKPAYLMQISKEDYAKRKPLMIFCNKMDSCNWVSMFLKDNNVPNVKLHGEINVHCRQELYNKFLEGEETILVCTDIASRGLDTNKVKHVLNYDFPIYASDYIHRCGRTGRLGSDINGLVTNLVSGAHEVDLVQKIEIAARLATDLPNVNANINRILAHKSAPNPAGNILASAK